MKQSPFDTRIGGSREVILGFLYVEFEFFSASGSSHQSWPLKVQRKALWKEQPCLRLGKFSPLSYYSFHLEQYP